MSRGARHSGPMGTSTRGAAVVTGAAGGLGLAIVPHCTSAGYEVLVTDVDGDAAAAAGAHFGGWSARLDVRYGLACEVVAERAVERAGRIALWVNNAGVLVHGPSWTHDEGTRRRMMDDQRARHRERHDRGARRHAPAGAWPRHQRRVARGPRAGAGRGRLWREQARVLAFSLGTLAELRAAGERGVDISCLCPGGIWTPMIHELADDPGAAASFAVTVLRPAQVARRVLKLADRPRPVVALPRWRGVQVRAFAAFPRLSLRLAGLMMARGRAGQRRVQRRQARSASPG